MKIVYTPDFVVSVKGTFAEVVKFAYEHKATCEPFKIINSQKQDFNQTFLYDKNKVAEFLNNEISEFDLFEALKVKALYRNKQPIYYRGNIQNLAPFDDCEVIEKDSLFKQIDRDLILVDDDQHFETTITGIFYEV
jgi:hypothetical protein